MRQKRSFWGLPFAAAALLVASACSDQGEGERCDANNGNADCSSGLVCTKASQLGGASTTDTWALCCPPSGSPATVAACQTKFPGFDAGGLTTPADSGSSSKPKPDAATTATPDAGATSDAAAKSDAH